MTSEILPTWHLIALRCYALLYTLGSIGFLFQALIHQAPFIGLKLSYKTINHEL